jgi:aryl-alcohol dehydrogenase-like predicted oxidoreductase
VLSTRTHVSIRARPLGKTGLVVSELSLGTWGLSGDGYGAVDDAVADRTIGRALDMGFTLFDTADAYGGGVMEARLGRILGGDHPNAKSAVVVTKVGTDRTSEPPRKRMEPDYLRARVQASLKRLKRERLDVVLLHNPSTDALFQGEAPGALAEMKKEGLVAHWGVAAGDAEVGRAAIDKGAEVVELAYNLIHAIDLHRLAGDAMVSGVGILARSVLAHGLLAGLWTKERAFEAGDHRADRWTRLELERRIDQLAAIRFLVRGDVHSMRAAAVRFVLANHLVSSAVLGPKSVEQLEQLVRETGSGPRYIVDEDLAALPRALSKVGILT